jgi:hypothetical protein
MSKAAPLKQNELVIHSTQIKPPAKRGKREYWEFDEYAEAIETLADDVREIFVLEDALASVDDDVKNLSKDMRERLDRLRFTTPQTLRSLYVEFAKGRQFYERDELYREPKKIRRDLTGTKQRREITPRVISEKISLLIGSYWNAQPHDPQRYMAMMVQEILAANPRASALEATCREWRRTQKFAPNPAEILPMLRKHAEIWNSVIDACEEDVERWIKLLAEVKAVQAKQKAEQRLLKCNTGEKH